MPIAAGRALILFARDRSGKGFPFVQRTMSLANDVPAPVTPAAPVSVRQAMRGRMRPPRAQSL